MATHVISASKTSTMTTVKQPVVILRNPWTFSYVAEEEDKKRKGDLVPTNDGSANPTNTTNCPREPSSIVSSAKDAKLLTSAKAPPETSSSSSSEVSSLQSMLKGYTGFMGPGVNQEKVLRFVQYTAWMLAFCCFRERQEDCQKLFRELASARYVLRFLGLPPAIEAAQSGSWAASSDTHPKLHLFLGKLMAWTMIFFYPLEHGAYLLWYTPKLLFPTGDVPYRLPETLSMWSCRFWFAYVLVELVQCGLKYLEETQKARLYAQQKKKDDAKTPVKGSLSSHKAWRSLQMQLLRAVLHVLPSLHWSLPNSDTNPWLSEPIALGLMWLESVVCLAQSVGI